MTKRFVRATHRARLPVQVWTIDNAPTMRRLLDLGADAIVANRPALAFEIVGTSTAWRLQGAAFDDSVTAAAELRQHVGARRRGRRWPPIRRRPRPHILPT